MTLSERTIKIPPFSVAAHSGVTFTSQVEDGLRQAIATGFYKDGDYIPGYVELAGRLGVSTAVVRQAIAALIADGLCQPRRGVGLRVCSKSPAKVGNVLAVIGGDAAAYRYYMASQAEHLRRHLAKNHFAMSRATVAKHDGREDFSELKEALNRHVNLVVLLDYSKGTERIVAASGVPYILLSPAPRSRTTAGYLEGDTAGAAARIAGHCADCGARRVLVAGLRTKGGLHVVPAEVEAALRDLGMETLRIIVGEKLHDGTAAELVRVAIDDFSPRCQKGRVEVDGYRPDMIVFLDDYVAQGALLAITAAGIRIPEDVQVVTLANKGLGPVWLKPLTQFEVDSAAEAELISDLVLDCLADRKTCHVRTTTVRFIEGETTRLSGGPGAVPAETRAASAATEGGPPMPPSGGPGAVPAETRAVTAAPTTPKGGPGAVTAETCAAAAATAGGPPTPPSGGPGAVPAAARTVTAATEGGPPTPPKGGPGAVTAEIRAAAAATEGGPPNEFPERRRPSHNSVHVPSGFSPIILFVTLATAKRQPVLATEAARSCLIAAWEQADNWIVGRYVIMPDHLHFFCSPAKWPAPDFHKWMTFWKSLVARSFPNPHAVPLWQRNCWDTQLRSGDSYSSKWQYVQNNPVRKGLVAAPDMWPFQGELHDLHWHE